MPKMTHWQEHISYRLSHDCDMAKISGFDELSQEHWVLIPHVDKTAPYRERRADAIELIQESIEAGDPPGELCDIE